MAYYRTVKIIRASGRNTTRRFSDFNHETGSYNPCDQVDVFIRKALAMPKTLRVEVDEEDTQLFGLPISQRTYQRAVVLKDGRAWQFYGHCATAAFLHQGPLRTFHVR